MNFRGYITIGLILLAILGASKDYSKGPNQEIVLQFEGKSISDSKAEATVAYIEDQLASLGITDIRVVSNGMGTFKILYYSDLESAEIERIFAEDSQLAIDYTTFPTERDPKESNNTHGESDYVLNVVELQSDTDAPWHLNGETFQLGQNKSRGDHSVVYTAGMSTAEVALLTQQYQRNTSQSYSVLGYKNPEAVIPEIRAGPATVRG